MGSLCGLYGLQVYLPSPPDTPSSILKYLGSLRFAATVLNIFLLMVITTPSNSSEKCYCWGD